MNRNVPARHRHIGLVIHGALVAAAAFGIVTATPATANDLWSGTIGQTAVVVELDSGTGGEDDRYFYRRHRLDLRAWGGHVRVWTEYGSGGDVPTGHWAMHTPPPAIGAAWEGSWIGRNGRALPIRLHVLAPAAEIHDAITAIPGINAYGRARPDSQGAHPHATIRQQPSGQCQTGTCVPTALHRMRVQPASSRQ